MKVYTSQRAEALLERMGALLEGRPLSDPFAREVLVTTSPGMRQWLEMRLAERLGIWANADVRSTRGLVELFCDAALGPPGEGADPFDPEALMWALCPLLRSLSGSSELFTPVAAYLRDDDGGDRLVALAARLANTFDHYGIYRPELLDTWRRGQACGLGDDEGWQAALWRALLQARGAPPQERVADAMAALQAGDLRGAVPERVCLFAPAAVPPAWLDIFAAASAATELHLFHLTPTPSFAAPAHPLVASMGSLARDHHTLLQERGVLPRASLEPLEEAAGPPSLLRRLQDEVGRSGAPAAPARLSPDDRSLSVHSVHGPMRELEVLHDQLLAAFAELPGLQPRDVVVLLADVEAYAPFVQAVFSSRGARIPFRIADRPLRSTHDAFDAFLNVLAVLGGRLPLSEVLDLLARPAVHERFGLRPEELPRLQGWLREAGVRWGADAEHREALGQPPLDDNTWHFGLQRLLLGYAAPGEPFCEVVPYDDVEGGDAAALGRLVSFVDALLEGRRLLRGRASVATWCERLEEVLGSLLNGEGPDAAQVVRVASALRELGAGAAQAGFHEEVDLAVVREQLQRGLERSATGSGLLSEGVTFCRLSSLRGVPARVVCVLGLDDGAFPRSRRDLSFDLMPRQPRPGDRNPRDDDRDAFLQALLAARDRLLLSYRGQSHHADEELPPSVVLEELLGHLEEAFVTEQGTVREQLVCKHPMHAFSRRYFEGEGPLFSYDAASCQTAERAMRTRTEPRPLLEGALFAAPVGAAEPPIVLDDLVELLDHPSRHFVRRVLGAKLPADLEASSDREPLSLNGLERWQVGYELLRTLLRGGERSAAERVARLGGRLPLGVPGDEELRTLSDDAAELTRACEGLSIGPRLGPVSIDVEVGGRRLVGVVSELWEAQGGLSLVQVSYSKLRLHKLLKTWVRLLALQLQRGSGSRALVVGRAPDRPGSVVVELTPGDAAAALEELVALYQLARQRPLLLFPGASSAYAEEHAKRPERALAVAEGVYRPTWGSVPGDAGDPYVSELFGVRRPLREDPFGQAASLSFEDLALRVYGPLLAGRSER